ncbi:hypothetical protein GCM10009846_04410 [Agrococcus versicolor]|uniref:HTH marR-type domain-containing protein n=1 Tax=Agrococcus versicolor TaxID=501482 RepID=A0ABP5MEM9_9MICO
MANDEGSEATGYWYPDRDGASTVDVLNLLRRYRAAESRMRARTRSSMEMGETDLLALRTLLAAQRTGALVRQRDLAKVLSITSASVTVLVDRLERSGHVERRAHPTDRRSTIVVPTTATEHEVRETLGAMHRRMIEVVDDLTAAELEVVARFLSGMAAAVEEAGDLDAELRDVVRENDDRQA